MRLPWDPNFEELRRRKGFTYFWWWYLSLVFVLGPTMALVIKYPSFRWVGHLAASITELEFKRCDR